METTITIIHSEMLMESIKCKNLKLKFLIYKN
jgi:hypothetical protein